MENQTQSTSPVQNQIKENNNFSTTQDSTSDLPSGSFTGGKTVVKWTRLAEFIGIIAGVIVIVGFVAGIIITQVSINNDVNNLTKSVDGYKNDNILIKTQIENWFNKIDNKLDNIKSYSKK